MTKLTYTRSREYRAGMLILLGMLAVESPLWLALAWFLHGSWRLIPLAVIALGLGIAIVLLTALNRPHGIDADGLTLRVGLGAVRIPRAMVASVSRFPGWVELPFSGRLTTYVASEDALVLAAASRGLVDIRLSEPCSAKVPKEGQVSFSRILLYVDDPAPLLAWAGAPPTAEAPEPAPPTAEAPEPAPAWSSPARGGSAPSHAGGGIIALNLSKRYGAFAAVADLSLSVRPGEVVALLGANGAGKSTTLGMLAGLVRPDAGAITMNGHDVWRDPLAARAIFGYVPDSPLFHESMTAREFLRFLGDLYGLKPDQARARADELLDLMRLTPRADSWALGYSLGMRRKLSIAAGLIHHPRILILDEITNGLDPRANREVVDLIAALAAQGTAVLLATHVLAVAEELASRIAVIHEGRLRAVGSLADLRHEANLPPDATLERIFLALTGGGDDA